MATEELKVSIRPLYLAKQDAAAYLSLSPSMLERLVQKKDAPLPRKLSAGRVAWRVDELDAWGMSRPVSDLLPPENCGVGRAGKQA